MATTQLAIPSKPLSQTYDPDPQSERAVIEQYLDEMFASYLTAHPESAIKWMAGWTGNVGVGRQ